MTNDAYEKMILTDNVDSGNCSDLRPVEIEGAVCIIEIDVPMCIAGRRALLFPLDGAKIVFAQGSSVPGRSAGIKLDVPIGHCRSVVS